MPELQEEGNAGTILSTSVFEIGKYRSRRDDDWWWEIDPAILFSVKTKENYKYEGRCKKLYDDA